MKATSNQGPATNPAKNAQHDPQTSGKPETVILYHELPANVLSVLVIDKGRTFHILPEVTQ